ncbi:hypothetical protein GCM10027082_33240 [Comamonas humi]
MQAYFNEQPCQPCSGQAECHGRGMRCSKVMRMYAEKGFIGEGLGEAGSPDRLPKRGEANEWEGTIHEKHK